MNEDRNANSEANRLGCQLLNNRGLFLFLCHRQLCGWRLVHSRWSGMFVELVWMSGLCLYLLGSKAHQGGTKPRQVCCLNLSTLIHLVLSKYNTKTCSTMRKQIKTSERKDFNTRFAKRHCHPSDRWGGGSGPSASWSRSWRVSQGP